MNDLTENETIKKALMLETNELTQFIDGISDKQLQKKVRFLVKDDTQLTQFLIETAAGTEVIKQPNVEDLKPGQKIQKLLIIKLIAKGGMGSVYLAYDELLKRNVAVKTIRAELIENASSRQRFEQEALILSQINHPSICQIYEYIKAVEGDLLVLEYIKGKTLKEYAFTDVQVLTAFIQIASALCAAHEAGVIHRDLKPDNIMITDAHSIKILDFGIAKSQITEEDQHENADPFQTRGTAEVNITQQGSLMGTLVYMSPEQAATLPITAASDMYSLGIIMQELLTGEAAYNLDNTEQLKKQVIDAQPLPAPKLSKDYQALITALTQKSPGKRPTAKRVLAQLEQMQRKPQEQRSKRRNWLFASLIVTLLVFLLWQWRSFDSKETQLNWMANIRSQIDANQNQLSKIYSLPRHDITTSMQQATDQQSKIVEQIKANQALNSAIRNRLLGESFYAIATYEPALQYFQQAWDAGDQSVQLAEYLAQTHDRLYWQNAYELTAAGLSESEKLRVSELNSQHLEKARFYYQFNHQQSLPQSSLLQAHSLFFECQYQQALAALDKEAAAAKGDYLVFEFEGRVYQTLYNKHINEGRSEQAIEYLNLAEKAFKQAINYGRSYPQPYASLCHVQQMYIENTILRTGENPSDYYQQAKSDCYRILEISPNDAFAMNSMSTNAYRMSEWMIRNGVNADGMLSEALNWNQKAMEISPDAQAYENKAIIHDVIALTKRESGQSPIPNIEIAMQAYDKVLELNPSGISRTTANMMYAMVIKFQYMLAHGLSMTADLKLIEQMLKLEKESPFTKPSQHSSLYNNLAYVYLMTAYAMRQQQQPVAPWAENSITAYQTVLTIDKLSPFAYAGMADNHILLAELAFENGESTAAVVSQAESLIDQSLAISEAFYWPILSQGNIEKLKTRVALEQGEDPMPLIQEGHQYFFQSLKLNDKYAPTHVFHAELYYLEMRHVSNKTLQQEAFDSGVSAINNALAIDYAFAEAWLLKSQFKKMADDKGLDSSAIELSVQQLMDKVDAINPKAILSI